MEVDWGEVIALVSIIIPGIMSLFEGFRPDLFARGFPNPFADFFKVHRLQLSSTGPHVGVIAFDTQQELLWTGDETVGNRALRLC